MNDADAPAGWYPAPHANGEQRYWDGAKWLDWTPDAAAAAQSSSAVSTHDPGAAAPAEIGMAFPSAPTQNSYAAAASYPGASHDGSPVSTFSSPARPRSKTIAILALSFGVGAFLTGWVPILGLLLAVVAIALGIAALVKGQPRSFALTGLILGAIALIASLVFTIGFISLVTSGSSSSAARDVPPVTTTPNPAPLKSEEPAEPEPEPAQPTTPDLAAFGVVDDRTFALIAKEPDAHIGTNLIVYGVVSQLDSATGPCNMLLDAAEAERESSFDYGQNTIATSGDGENVCPVFDPLVEDDHVRMWVTVLGSYSHDTQIGGNTTVPAFEVWQAELLPAQEY